MKKRIALLLCGMSAASAVWATDTVNIDVDVTVDAAACTPALSNGGVADFGTRYAGRSPPAHSHSLVLAILHYR